MNHRTLQSLLLAGALALPIVARADPSPTPAAEAGHEHGHGKNARLYLVLRMADTLGLSDERALAVSRVLKASDDKREALRQKRGDVERKMREALGQSKPDDKALATLVDQSVEIRRQQTQLGEDTFGELKKILSVEEQAKFVLLRAELHDEFRFHGSHGKHGMMEDHGSWRRHHHGGDDGDDGPGPRHGGHGPAVED
jgi:heavy-metal resistance protein